MKVVVALVGLVENIPNFSTVVPTMKFEHYGKQIDVRFIAQGPSAFHGTELSTSSDFVVNYNAVTEDYPHGDPLLGDVVHIRRYRKDSFSVAINHFGLKYGRDNFRSVPTYTPFYPKAPFTNNDIPGQWFLHPQLILKPLWGARGDGQLLFNMSTDNIEDVSRKLFTSNYNVLENDVTVSSISSLETVVIRSREYGYFLQEYITDIVKEYRIIRTPDYYLICHRERVSKDNGLIQASGRDCGSDPKYVKLDEIDDIIGIGFHETIEAVRIEFGAIDVFMDSTGRWGIFEYSPEFGNYGLGPKLGYKLVHDTMEFWIKRFIDKDLS